MPIEFIRENTYALGSFEYFLQKLQMGYGTILSLMQVFSGQFINLIPEIADTLTLRNVEDMSHSLARCYTTRSILSNIFGLDKWYKNPDLISDDMHFRVVSISGKFFPDHTFILIKYHNALYVLQSYYYSYLIAGKYGILKLTAGNMHEMEIILETYKFCANKRPDIKKINETTEKLSKYTGVNYRIHAGNTQRKRGLNSIEILETYANSQCVMRYIENKMNSFEDVLFSEIGSPDDIIALNFHYYFSDAFKPEAHPLLQAEADARVGTGRPEPRIIDLPYDQQMKIFRDLIGTEYAITTFHGVDVGPFAIPGILAGTFPVDPFTRTVVYKAHVERSLVSVKTIKVTVQQIVDVFVNIKQAAFPLLYSARIENLQICTKLPQLKPVIILDAYRQLEKSNLVANLKANGLLPDSIPPGTPVPVEIYPVFSPP